MLPTTVNELHYTYCHSHRDLVGKVLRKLSGLILYLFNGNTFELQLVDEIYKIVKRMGKVDSRIKYFYYLLCIGRFKANYIKYLAKNQMYQAVEEKEKWANFLCSYSESEYEIKSAEDYLFLLGKYGLSGKVNNYSSFNIIPNKTERVNNIFYLFGPNSDYEPNRKYVDSTIVLAKEINSNISHFKDSIIFLNWIYYQKKVKNDVEKRRLIIKKYGKVFVSSMYPIDDLEFPLSVMPISSTLGGAQGLGRALFNLITKYGRCSCIIEGYDFYLAPNTYSNNYPSLTRKGNEIDEEMIVRSLSDHDAVYNFLFVKEMLNHIDIIDSSKFLEYINMSIDQYIKKLIDRRDFTLLSY